MVGPPFRYKLPDGGYLFYTLKAYPLAGIGLNALNYGGGMTQDKEKTPAPATNPK